MDGHTCEPVCNLACLTGSYCSEPSHCACLNGYTEIILLGRRILNVGKKYNSFEFVKFEFCLFNTMVTINVNIKSKLKDYVQCYMSRENNCCLN